MQEYNNEESQKRITPIKRIVLSIALLFVVILADFCLGDWTRNFCVFGLVKCSWISMMWTVAYILPLLVIILSVVYREQRDVYRY